MYKHVWMHAICTCCHLYCSCLLTRLSSRLSCRAVSHLSCTHDVIRLSLRHPLHLPPRQHRPCHRHSDNDNNPPRSSMSRPSRHAALLTPYTRYCKQRTSPPHSCIAFAAPLFCQRELQLEFNASSSQLVWSATCFSGIVYLSSLVDFSWLELAALLIRISPFRFAFSAHSRSKV